MHEERLDEFLTHSLDDVRNSVATEPGCRQFDLNVSADGSPTVVFYDDRAAFEAHLQTPHFFRWRDATQGPHHLDPDLLPAPPLIYGRRQKGSQLSPRTATGRARIMCVLLVLCVKVRRG